MLKLFHAPVSRSTAIVTLIEEMGIADRVRIELVSIPRADGSGHRDLANPHPEGKVPALLAGDTVMTERAAIMLFLTEAFPGTGMAPEPGDPRRAAFLTWMNWYGAVHEPVLIHGFAGLDNDLLRKTFRGTAEVEARLRAALENGPYLLGDSFTAADLLCHSPYAWFPEATPDDPLIRGWVDRCKARPATQRVLAAEQARSLEMATAA